MLLHTLIVGRDPGPPIVERAEQARMAVMVVNNHGSDGYEVS